MSTRLRGHLFIVQGILSLALVAPSAFADTNPRLSDLEYQSRVIDRAARVSMDQAIQGIQALLARSPREDREERLLRLVELSDEKSALSFRIATGAPSRQEEKELQLWKASLLALEKTTTTYLTEFTTLAETPRVQLLRAKAREELGLKAGAREDYIRTIALVEQSEQKRSGLRSAAILALATLEATENRHKEAVLALRKLDTETGDSRWLVSRFKLAWSLHNLGNFSEILTVIRSVAQEIPSGNTQIEQAIGTGSDTSLRDALWMDLPVFASDASEKQQSAVSLEQLDKLFHEITSENLMGLRARMQLRMAKLIRSQKRDSELETWIDFSLGRDEDANSPEAPRLSLIALDYFLQQALESKTQPAMERAARWAYRLSKNKKVESDALEEARVFLASKITAILSVENQKPTDADFEFTGKLQDSLLRLLAEKDERRITLARNRGEILFRNKKFQEAEMAYQSGFTEAEHQSRSLDAQDLLLRKIGARVASLKETGAITSDLKAVSIDAPALANADQKKQVLEALQWIKSAQGRPETWQSAQLDLLRGLYRTDARAESLTLLDELALKAVQPEVAISASALVVDTRVASKDWTQAAALASKHSLNLVRGDATATHRRTLERIESQSRFLLIQQRFDSLDLVRDSQSIPTLKSDLVTWLRKSPSVENRADAQGLLARIECLGQGAQASSNQSGACQNSIELWIRQLNEAQRQQDPGPWLLRSEIGLAQWNWKQAETDLREALKRIQDSKNSIVSKAAIEETAERLRTWLEGKSTEAELSDCGQALKQLEDDTAHEKNYRKHLKAVRTLAREWKTLSESKRAALMQPLARILPKALETLRRDLRVVAPLIATPKYIQWRIDALREFENHLAQVAEIPYAAIRVSALMEVAQASEDLARDIETLKFPKATTAAERVEAQTALSPLLTGVRSKSQEIFGQAQSLATQMRLSASDTADLPSWEQLQLPIAAPARFVETLRKIVEQGNLPGTIALLKDAQEKLIIDEAIAKKIHSLALLRAGYAAEARLEWRGES